MYRKKPNVIAQYYYRPQTKFAKVMFSQVSVCPRRTGGCARQGGVSGGGDVHDRGVYMAGV